MEERFHLPEKQLCEYTDIPEGRMGGEKEYFTRGK